MRKLDSFTRAYLECMLWAECANLGDDSDDRSFQDHGFEIDNLDPDTLARAVLDCERFQSAFGEVIDDDTQAGHDFWLDRGGHGAGALDRSCSCPVGPDDRDPLHLGSRCPRNILRHAGAVWMGHVDAYVGDDESIYMSPDPFSAAMHARRLERKECAIVDNYLQKGDLPE